jgi:hypothetical protein
MTVWVSAGLTVETRPRRVKSLVRRAQGDGVDPELSVLTSTVATTAVQLLARLADADPPQGATITMQITTFGNSRVNQASRGLHVSIRE